MAFVPPNPVPLWPAFFPSAPVVPKLYYDALSPEQRMKKLCEEIQRLCDYANTLGVNINLDREELARLQAEFQRFIDGAYDEYYENALYEWIQEHFADLISAGIKQVFFGLTDDGYFCAYVPDSWSEISFDTGAVFGRSDYGRLILQFEPDPNARNVLDNRYQTYTLNGPSTTLEQLVADLEITTRRGDMAFETLFTNMDQEVQQYGNL